MDIMQLEEIGLSHKEARVYLALLQLPESTVLEISQKTKLNRTSLYSILEEMCRKGTVTYILKNNVRYYRPIEPNKILDLMKEKEKIFSNILPELMALHKPLEKRPVVEILEGKEGIKTILNYLLRVKKEWYAFNAPGKGPEILGPMVDAFETERERRKITLKVIMVNNEQAHKRGQQFLRWKYTYVKYNPHAFESPASNWIYGDRIAILFWHREFPFAIRIIDKSLADSYKTHFNMVWEGLKFRH